MSIARHHAEWLALLDISGPFLSLKTLVGAFPQGLDAPDAEVAHELRMTYEEWRDSAFGTRPDPAMHRAWVEWVIRRVLGMPDAVMIAQHLTVVVPEHGETLRPDLVIGEPSAAADPEPGTRNPRILVQIVPPGQDLEKAPAKARWQASPATRMMTLLRGTGVRLGLLTNGEQWMLVDRPADENFTTGFASWYARLWLDEPLTLRAFRSLLGAHRIFGVSDASTLEAMLTASADDRQEVTDQLGYQVRHAVELLVQAIDLADQNAGRAILTEVREERIYEAALAVMMRLVFLLFAEEQGLLLLGDDIYDHNYAVSTLRETLREDADHSGEEVLERRHDAWGRLLAIFRAVYDGFDHDKLDMPAYGGSLFDPDRYPFLEGRADSTPEPDGSRKDAKAQSGNDIDNVAAREAPSGLPGLSGFAALREIPAPQPLLISNRVVLHLLDALQVLRVKLRDGSPAEARRVSFRSLDIEQIGHVYEGLLDHTALRATEPVLGIAGTRDQEPEIPLRILEEIVRKVIKPEPDGLRKVIKPEPDGLRKAIKPEPDGSRKDAKAQSENGNDNVAAREVPSGLPGLGGFAALRESPAALRDAHDLIIFLREQTGRSENALKKALDAPLDPWRASQFRSACGNDESLYARVLPFAGLVRDDDYDRPMVIPAGSVYVTAGTERRATGTHYTPRSLTEPIVQHTLEPLVYIGPAEGLPKEQWRLRPAAELLQLTVCDMAMGSGAFLVQACRYLSERLVEAWEQEDALTQDALTQSRKEAKAQSEEKIETSASLPLSAFALESSASLPLRAFALESSALKTDPAERLIYARRMIADRCLYGVDKNPLAVEMAKLSLWLITMSKGQPFSFLDHALRAGDSLLGISDVEQLVNWSLRTGEARKDGLVPLVRAYVQRAISFAIHERRRISTTPMLDSRDASLKASWLGSAEAAVALLKLGADLLIAAELHPDKGMRSILRTTWEQDYALLMEAAETSRVVSFTPGGDTDRANLDAFANLRKKADEILQGRQPFHWPLEFPEVFLEEVQPVDVGGQQAMAGFGEVLGPLFGALEVQSLDQGGMGFAAIVGNPPFLWGMRITTSFGQNYYDYLKLLINKSSGTADLCAYFLIHAYMMLNQFGFLGMVATNTISQGDTRELAIDFIIDSGGLIYRAIKSQPWPGGAAIEYAIIHATKSNWVGALFLENDQVNRISRFLDDTLSVTAPERLLFSAGTAFIGHYVMGMGFILQEDELNSLIKNSSSNRKVIFPFLNGSDVTDSPEQRASRWAINFGEMELNQATQYSDCLKIVQDRVKPERDLANRKANRERWWRYAETRPGMMAAIESLENVYVQPSPSKYLLMARVSSRQVFAHPMVIFSLDRYGYFSVLLSNLHEVWVRQFSSTLETRMRYTPSDCFETFPFPACLQEEASRQGAKPQSAPGLSGFAPWREPSGSEVRELLESIGEQYHTHRQEIMLRRQEGLTKTYNRFHAPTETADDIAELRRLHVEMDNAVATAYGWDDLDLGHGFHQTKQGLRYTISEAARRTVLDRLLALNHARYAEEVAEGLHDKGGSRKGAKAQRGGKGKVEGQGELL
ncbi:MAG: type IIL restriction-modification enzyme MmeI [Chloroflexales bacterium]